MEIWDVYDIDGNKTGRTVVRGEELQEGDYHLVVHIWIMNDQNEFLIQKRAAHLERLPNIWAKTGGSAVQGEDSKTAAIREVEEELGIKADARKMKKVHRMQRRDNYTDIWLIEQNVDLVKDIKLQKEEVAEVSWVDWETLQKMIDEGIFYDYGETYFNLMRKYSK